MKSQDFLVARFSGGSYLVIKNNPFQKAVTAVSSAGSETTSNPSVLQNIFTEIQKIKTRCGGKAGVMS